MEKALLTYYLGLPLPSKVGTYLIRYLIIVQKGWPMDESLINYGLRTRVEHSGIRPGLIKTLGKGQETLSVLPISNCSRTNSKSTWEQSQDDKCMQIVLNILYKYLGT